MAGITSWDVVGYRDRPVPNRFFETDGSERLAVFLPGIRYTNDAPLLYYARQLAFGRQMDVLAVDYGYGFDRRFQELPGDARERWMREDLDALQGQINERDHYRQLLLVTKSLGTILASRLLASGVRQECRVAWLTPVLTDEGVRRSIQGFTQPSHLVIGTEDQYYDAEALNTLRENESLTIDEIEGADHRVEARGDIDRSLEMLRRYLDGLRAFVERI